MSNEKKYAEAFQAFKAALTGDPENPLLLYNAGLTAFLAEKPEEAIPHWTQLKALEPSNWRVRSKLIQAYEAVGRRKDRDAERAELLRLRKETKEEQWKEEKLYCRDQFVVGKTHVMVFEYFELDGVYQVRLSFTVLGPDKLTIKARYTLESDKTTNAIAQSTKELKPGERLFSLDGYWNDENAQTRTHATFGFYTGEPDYDKIKPVVKGILEGKCQPISKTVTAQGTNNATVTIEEGKRPPTSKKTAPAK